MTTTVQNWEMYQGETKEVTIKCTDAAGNPLTMTDGAVTWYLMRNQSDKKSKVALTKTLAAGQIALVDLDGTDDGARFTLAPNDSRRLDGEYFHELWLVDTSGREGLMSAGKVTIKPSGGQP